MKIKKLNKSVFIKTNLITNFKPSILNNFKDYNMFKKNERIYCKNFFIFLLLLKYKNAFIEKSNVFIKKYNKNTITILRSPYRHKLARHQINLNRYIISNTIEINLNNEVKFKSWKNILGILYFFKKSNKFFESNLIYSNNILVSIPIKFNENFFLKNF